MEYELQDGRVAGSQETDGKTIRILGPIKGKEYDWAEIKITIKDAKHLQEWFNVLWPTK